MKHVALIKSEKSGEVIDEIVEALECRNNFIFEEFKYEDIEKDKLESFEIVILFGFRLHLPITEHIVSEIVKSTHLGTHVIFWTHESFWDHHRGPSYFRYGRFFHHMNCYTGDVFVSQKSFYFGEFGKFWSKDKKARLKLPPKEFLEKRFRSDAGSKVCAYATRFDDVYFNEQPFSLTHTRNKVIEYFYKRDICSIEGNGWGNLLGNKIASTRSGKDAKSWGEIKIEQSRKLFSFSICLENTIYHNYVTEKISHALESWLIPIYCFENGLTEITKDAALHISSTPNESEIENVFNSVINMKFSEYFERLNVLLDDYNKLLLSPNLLALERLAPVIEIEKKIEKLFLRVKK